MESKDPRSWAMNQVWTPFAEQLLLDAYNGNLVQGARHQTQVTCSAFIWESRSVQRSMHQVVLTTSDMSIGNHGYTQDWGLVAESCTVSEQSAVKYITCGEASCGSGNPVLADCVPLPEWTTNGINMLIWHWWKGPLHLSNPLPDLGYHLGSTILLWHPENKSLSVRPVLIVTCPSASP